MQTFIRITIAAAMLASAGAAQAQAVQLQKPVPFAQDNDVSDAIKGQCQLGEKLADFVKERSSVPVELTSQAPNSKSGRVLQMEISDVPSGRRRTHWKNSVPIAPWLYVLGAARFAVQRVGAFDGKAIETWVYAQDRDAGFADFPTPTKDVLAYYTDYVGPFAFERLANIQSNSVRGGMEAASAILYSESSVTGTGSVRWRNVVIHEIAHQWFGNAVTEADWNDVWLVRASPPTSHCCTSSTPMAATSSCAGCSPAAAQS